MEKDRGKCRQSKENEKKSSTLSTKENERTTAEMKRRGKQVRGDGYKTFIIASTIGIIIISIGCVAVSVFLTVRMYQLDSIDLSASMINNGMSIIGLAVAVWAGLNISNVVSRKDIQQLQADTECLMETSDILKTDHDAMYPFFESNRDVMLQLFLLELERSGKDPVIEYYLDRIRRLEGKEVDVQFSDLIEIELMFSQVRLRHKSAYQYDEVLLSIADKGIEKVDLVMSNIKDDESLLDIISYLEYRKNEFSFYKGYCDRDRMCGAGNFYRAAHGYEKLLDEILVSTCEKNEVNYNTLSCDRRTGYIENSIGEAYSKIVHYYTDWESAEKDVEGFRQLIRNWEADLDVFEISVRAVSHCKNATRFMNDRRFLATFWRNLGCAYERQDRIKGVADDFSNYADVVRCYQKAFSCIVNNFDILNETGRNTYYTLLAYFKKLIEFFIPSIHEPNERYDAICESFRNSDKKDELIEYILNMYRISSVAIVEHTRSTAIYALHGFSCGYMAILLNVGECDRLKNVELHDIHEYYEEMLQSKLVLDLMGIVDMYSSQLKGLLSIIEQKVKGVV